MPHNIELNQAIDILSLVDETYRRAEQLKQVDESGFGSGLEKIVTLARLERAYLMLINMGGGQQKTVPFAETGFPALSTLLSDARLALTEHSEGSTNTKHVVLEILADFGKIDQAALAGKARDRAQTLCGVSEFMNLMSRIKEQQRANAQRNIMVAHGAYDKKDMPFDYARFWESQGALVVQFYQAKTKNKPEWFSKPKGFKFIPSENSEWKSFFLDFTRKDDLERATSWWNNKEMLFPKKMIPQAIAQQDSVRDAGVLALLTPKKEPWIDCVKALNTSATIGYNATIFSILQEADNLIQGLASVAKSVDRQTDRQVLEKLSHDLAGLALRIDELPNEARPPVKNAIKTAVEHAVAL